MIDRHIDILILDPDDQLAYTRCSIKLKRIDNSLEKLGRVFIPNKWDPVEYIPHDTHQRSEVEHLLERIQAAECFGACVKDEKLKRELLEDVMMRRLIFYDLVDIVRAKERSESEKEKEGAQQL